MLSPCSAMPRATSKDGRILGPVPKYGVKRRYMDPYTIGQLARAAGVNVETVRYYQRRQLVAEPRRPLNGIRRYPEESVGRIRFIKRAQELGFTLAEIANLLALEDGRNCSQAREL